MNGNTEVLIGSAGFTNNSAKTGGAIAIESDFNNLNALQDYVQFFVIVKSNFSSNKAQWKEDIDTYTILYFRSENGAGRGGVLLIEGDMWSFRLFSACFTKIKQFMVELFS